MFAGFAAPIREAAAAVLAVGAETSTAREVAYDCADAKRLDAVADDSTPSSHRFICANAAAAMTIRVIEACRIRR
ncbi:MAG: hypothetical protein WA740_01045 [Candidatus Binataceae bacterium]